MDTTLCPRNFQVHGFASTWKTKAKHIATSRPLGNNYEILMLSLRSLGPVCRKRKLKDQIGWIEETNCHPYESVIPGIETLHFTSPGARTSIAFLGKKSDVPSRFVRKE
jgi:hypothetical protein